MKQQEAAWSLRVLRTQKSQPLNSRPRDAPSHVFCLGVQFSSPGNTGKRSPRLPPLGGFHDLVSSVPGQTQNRPDTVLACRSWLNPPGQDPSKTHCGRKPLETGDWCVKNGVGHRVPGEERGSFR